MLVLVAIDVHPASSEIHPAPTESHFARSNIRLRNSGFMVPKSTIHSGGIASHVAPIANPLGQANMAHALRSIHFAAPPQSYARGRLRDAWRPGNAASGPRREPSARHAARRGLRPDATGSRLAQPFQHRPAQVAERTRFAPAGIDRSRPCGDSRSSDVALAVRRGTHAELRTSPLPRATRCGARTPA